MYPIAAVHMVCASRRGPGTNAVLRGAAFCLAHVPGLVRHGSKPRREIARNPALDAMLARALRPLDAAVAYPPNQAFVGNLHPHALDQIARPWYATPHEGAKADGSFGEIVGETTFLALLQRANVLEPPLFRLSRAGAEALGSAWAAHPLLAASAGADFPAEADDPLRESIVRGTALPILAGEKLLGVFTRDERAEGREDESLSASNLLENLCAKASGALAVRRLLARTGLAATDVDFLVSCGEEAVGDRYQRGGGGMAKAIGELVGCENASGMDVKNFCAAPASALVVAASLVKAGLHERVVVVGGGSLAKLGMKFQGALQRGVPVLEDALAAMAFLVTIDDAVSPVLRIEPGAVGCAPIGASTSDEAVYRSLLLGPLAALGLGVADVDRYAPELHNPEIMELSGSGDVAQKNYRSIAAMAVLDGQIGRGEMDALIARVGMPGFAPDQGHVPSGVAYLGHAHHELTEGALERVMVLSKASLFLGRCTELYDGVSFLVERNPARRG